MKKKHIGERPRYIIIVSAFLIVLNVTLGVFLISLSKSALTTQIEDRMLDISNTAADMLDGDKLKNLKKEDFYTKDYQDAIKTLAWFQSNIRLQYIYCIQAVGEKEFVFSIDPTEKDPGEFGSPIVYTDALYRASKGHASVDKEPYEDSWGRFYSSYSPVFDSDGNVAIIVAVDFSADWYDEQVFALVRTVLIICGLSILAGGLIVFLIMNRTHKRNRRLYAELNLLSDNVEALVNEVSITTHIEHDRHFDTVQPNTGDDITDLSQKIKNMQENLRSEISFVHKMAYIDALTAVGNTAAYIKVTKKLNDQIADGTAAFSVAAFDLNGLKYINDKYGHECGDKALADTSEVICKVFGKESLYRVGGDEFIAVILSDDAAAIDELFARFDKELAEENKKEKSYSFPIYVSKGYAVYQKDTDSEYKDVSHRADLMMYRDKDEFYKEHSDFERR